MKAIPSLMVASLLSVFSMSAFAECTDVDAVAKAEEVAETVHRLAGGDPVKANELYEQLVALQLRNPTTDEHNPCEAYDRIVEELKEQNAPIQ